MYKLKKLELEADKESSVENGYITESSVLSVLDTSTKEIRETNSLDDVTEHVQVYLTGNGMYHRTSAVSEIVSRIENVVVFKTQTSTYELSKI